jgi:hypothetical protein
MGMQTFRTASHSSSSFYSSVSSPSNVLTWTWPDIKLSGREVGNISYHAFGGWENFSSCRRWWRAGQDAELRPEKGGRKQDRKGLSNETSNEIKEEEKRE